MDKIERLKIFCMVAEKQSFSQVAKQLNLPRSTITYAIQALEKEYEILLFYRTTRNVALTHAGQGFYEETLQLFNHLKDLNRFKSIHKGNVGKISIGMPQRIATRILIPYLYEYYEKYPDIQVLINSRDDYSHLIEEQLDCVVRVGEVQDEYLIVKNIGTMKIVTLVSPDYVKKYGKPENLDDLTRHKAVEYNVGKTQTDTVVLSFFQHNFKVGYSVLVENTEAYLQAGLAGLGIIQIPEYDANQYIQENKLICIFNEIEPLEVPVQMLFLERKYRPQYLQDFIDWLEIKLKQVFVSAK